MPSRIQAPELVSAFNTPAAGAVLRVNPTNYWRKVYAGFFYLGATGFENVVWNLDLIFRLDRQDVGRWRFDWRQSADGAITPPTGTKWDFSNRNPQSPPFWIETIPTGSANFNPVQPPGDPDELVSVHTDIINSQIVACHMLPLRTFGHFDEIELSGVSGYDGTITGVPTARVVVGCHSTAQPSP